MGDTYNYDVEDGQFSFQYQHSQLLGKEGDAIYLGHDAPVEDCKVYILYIEGNFVQCIGNVERSFPKDPIEHEELKEFMLQFTDELGDYLIFYENSDGSPNEEPILVSAYSEQEAIKQFEIDYPDQIIYKVD